MSRVTIEARAFMLAPWAAAAPTPSLDPVMTMVRSDTCAIPLIWTVIAIGTGKPYWYNLQYVANSQTGNRS